MKNGNKLKVFGPPRKKNQSKSEAKIASKPYMKNNNNSKNNPNLQILMIESWYRHTLIARAKFVSQK